MIEEVSGSKRKVWVIGVVIFICVIIILIFTLFLVGKGKDICDNLDSPSVRESCKLCNELENPSECKDTVYMNLATMNADASLCNQIVQEDKKNNCLSISMSGKAIREDDISLCETLDNKIVITNCRDRFFYFKSRQKDDRQLCEKISDESLRNMCVSGETIKGGDFGPVKKPYIISGELNHN